MKSLLHNCRLIPELSDGWDKGNANILINGDKIERITETGDLPDADTTIECGGKTLLPGLIDLHVHLCTAGCGMGVEYKNDFDLMEKAIRNAHSFLSYGYTTIRDMGSTNGVASSVRNLAASGLIVSPRILACGKMLLPAGMLEKSDENTAYHEVSGIQEIRRAVREEMGETKGDLVKIYASGSAYNPTGKPLLPIMTREEIRAAVEMADMMGRKVAAHCHCGQAIRYCVEEGVYTIEHASYIDPDVIQLVKQKNCYLVPTLTPFYHDTDKDPDKDLAELRKKMLLKMLDDVAPHIKAAYDAGLKLGYGSDTIDGDWSGKVGMEFKFRKEKCGMTNLDMLLQATKYSAEIAGLSDITGQIKSGLAADLILVNGNPDEDISVLYYIPEKIWANGHRFQ